MCIASADVNDGLSYSANILQYSEALVGQLIYRFPDVIVIFSDFRRHVQIFAPVTWKPYFFCSSCFYESLWEDLEGVLFF